MKRKRFTEEQIAAVLKQAELGVEVKDLCRKFGFTETKFYRWKKQYAGIEKPIEKNAPNSVSPENHSPDSAAASRESENLRPFQAEKIVMILRAAVLACSAYAPQKNRGSS